MSNAAKSLDLNALSALSYVPQELLAMFVTLTAQAKTLEAVKEFLVDALKRNLTVEKGDYAASLTVREASYPAWKQEFIAIAGEDAASAVLSNTPKQTSYSVKVREV